MHTTKLESIVTRVQMERRKSLFKNRRKTIAFYDTLKEESEPEIEEFEEVKLPVIHIEGSVQRSVNRQIGYFA